MRYIMLHECCFCYLLLLCRCVCLCRTSKHVAKACRVFCNAQRCSGCPKLASRLSHAEDDVWPSTACSPRTCLLTREVAVAGMLMTSVHQMAPREEQREADEAVAELLGSTVGANAGLDRGCGGLGESRVGRDRVMTLGELVTLGSPKQRPKTSSSSMDQEGCSCC